MNIFTTIYESQFSDTMRSLQFELLVKLAGSNAEKFECFRPVIGGMPTQKTEQWRKAEFVKLLIDMHLAGVNFDDLPTGCNCEQLAGNVCEASADGYAALVAGIKSIGG